jgi:hypothetical protein
MNCSDEAATTVSVNLSCQIVEFPIIYLGIPLSLRKMATAQLQPLVRRSDGSYQPGRLDR